MLLDISAKIVKFVIYECRFNLKALYMANLSKIKRDQMIAFLESLKESHSDDASIQAFNEIENHIRDKKYGLVWEEHSEEVDDLLKENIPILTADPERRLCKDASLPWNFIIEGDNLQALYLLEKTHKGKVDCIYIDPPYNTGARDWKYNNDYVDGTDVYRHSKWLSMMKNRLLLAKELLNPSDSVLICTIDEKEYLRLGCLLEELFPEGNIQMISTVIKAGGVSRGSEFNRTNEFIYFVYIGDGRPSAVALSGEWLGGVKNTTKNDIRWRELRRTSSQSLRIERPHSFFPIFVLEDGSAIHSIGDPYYGSDYFNEVIPPEGTKAIWPLFPDGREGRWQVSKESIIEMLKKGYIRMGKFTKNGMSISYLSEGEQKKVERGDYKIIGHRDDGSIITDNSDYTPFFIPGTVWQVSTHDATENGTKLLSRFVGKRFSYPKSLYAVKDTIRFVVANKPNAIIVDFFAGSGTTFHAVNLLNAEDGGHRKCIMVTNNEVSAIEAKELSAKGLKPGDEEWEKYGISKYVTWPRTKCSIEGVDLSGKPLQGNYLSDTILSIPLAQGFISNVKYFKCGWTPRKPEDYLLSNALCLHIKEMIELQNAIEVDNVTNVLILNKEDFRRTILNADVRPHIERVWVNQNIIFSTEELKALKEIGYKYIPREFFGQELREAAE